MDEDERQPQTQSGPQSPPAYESPPRGWRTFLIVWFTQSISVFGSALTFFALTIWLTQVLYPNPEQKQALAAALSITSLAFALPTVFIAPIAGAWADRHDRKLTMLAMDVVSGIISLVITALMLTHGLNLWALVVIIVTSSTVGAFHYSAFDSSYAMIVPERLLPRANGMMQTIWSLSGIISPVIAATLIALPALARQGHIPGGLGAALARLTTGAPLATAIDALTFFLAAATLLFVFIPSPKRTDLGLAPSAAGRPKLNKSIWADVREGALYIWRRKPMLWLLGTFAVINFLSAPVGVFEPLLLKFNLARDWAAHGYTFETALAMMSTMSGIGGVAGGFLVSAWGGLKVRRVYGVIAPMVLEGVLLIVFGLSPMFYVASGAVLLQVALAPIMNAHSQTIWQIQTPRELQGRVFAVRRVIAQFTWPLGTALAGWAGGRFNPGTVIAVMGGIMSVFAAIQLLNPYLLRVEDKAYLEELAARAEGRDRGVIVA